MYKWSYADDGYDRRISVVLTNSVDKAAPTVDVIDQGIGITPEAFAGTILSLHQRNKMTKSYVMGAFGQGEHSTLAFCDYAVMVSRHCNNPRVVGFTVIRVAKLGGDYKEDCHAYLCLRARRGLSACPRANLRMKHRDLPEPQSEGPQPVHRHTGSACVLQVT